MALEATARPSEEHEANPTLLPTPGKGCLLRSLSSKGRAEDATSARAQWAAKVPKKGAEEDVSKRISVSVPAEPVRAHVPFLKPRLESVGQAGKPPRAGGKMHEIVVREADLRKYGHDLRKLRECQVMPSSPTMGGKKDFDLSFKSAFALKCRDGAELRDPWQGMKNPEYTREQSEQDLVLNQVWVNAMQPRKKLYDLSPRYGDEEEAPEASPRLSMKPEVSGRAELSPTMAPLPSAGKGQPMAKSGSRRRSYRKGTSQSCLCQHRSCLSCQHSHGSCRHGDDRPWSHDTNNSARGSRTRGEQRTASKSSKDTKPAEVENRIKNIEEVLGDEDDDLDNLVGSMAVRASVKMQKANMRKLSDKLYYDENPRAAWLAVNTETGDVTFYHKSVGERLESAYRCGRQSVPLAGLGRDMDGTIVTFLVADEAGPSRIVETSLKGKRRELLRVGVPGTLREIHVGLVREGGLWRFAADGDRERAARVAEEGSDDPEEDFVFQERKMAVTGQEIVMPENKLPPVNRSQRIYFINPTFTEYY